ncbi:MAG: FlgD immunoglobulin-like domain containing protein [Syntrophobacteraceae bacterium]
MKLRHLHLAFCLSAGIAIALSPAAIYGQGAPAAQPPRVSGLSVSEVSVAPKVFRPASGEKVDIRFRCSEPARVNVRIFDPQMRLIRELLADNPGGQGLVKWDGRDERGVVAPDEAYFFTIDAVGYKGNAGFYDPTVTSGGELFKPENLRYDANARTVRFDLPKDARVNVRVGVASGGPLLRNILCAAPESAGEVAAPWDGLDESGKIDIAGGQGFKLAAEAVTLPDNSIFVVGNAEGGDYLDYLLKGLAERERPKKMERPSFQSSVESRNEQFMQQYGLRPVQMVPEPRFRMEFPGALRATAEGVPVVRGKVQARISLDDRIKPLMTEMRYEILLFVDNRFVTEMEEGRSPFNLQWDSSSMPNGEHIVTVNIATITGQLGAGSVKVVVENQ